MIIIGTQCCIFVVESFNFKSAQLLKLGVNSWHNMADAEPDVTSRLSTSSRPSMKFRITGAVAD